MRILILDDKQEICNALSDYLKITTEHSVFSISDSNMAISTIRKNEIDLLISDVRMPELTGTELVRKLRKQKIKVDIILVSGEDDIINSINTIDLGVYDFITKPVDLKKLSAVIAALENEKQRKHEDFTALVTRKFIRFDEFGLPPESCYITENRDPAVLHSSVMKTLLKKIRKVAAFSEIPILVTGKTGSGKEIIARIIHQESSGKGNPFIALNCAAIEKTLFESELFGYEKGAFTGADQSGKPGKIALAEGGTLFLDEITEISPDLQTKLLRVLQEREYYPVGGNKSKKVGTRFVFATNRDIQGMVQEKTFREDLYYRLEICRFEIPSLAERKEDIIPLAMQIMKDMSARIGLAVSAAAGSTLQYLLSSPWPGNIRQLKNTITRAMLFCDNENLTPDDFEKTPSGRTPADCFALDLENLTLPENPFSLDTYIEKIIVQSLMKFNGNKSKAAEFLGLDRFQFYRRYRPAVEKYDHGQS